MSSVAPVSTRRDNHGVVHIDQPELEKTQGLGGVVIPKPSSMPKRNTKFLAQWIASTAVSEDTLDALNPMGHF